MEIPEVFTNLGIALGLGLLVGLQRERADSQIAGIRTFPLITLAGAVAFLVGGAIAAEGWVVGAGAVAIGIIIYVGNMHRVAEPGGKAPGVTTEAAMLVMYLVGALVMTGARSEAVLLGGVTAILLHAKRFLHSLTDKLGDKDMRAVMQFALLTMIILPVLPAEPFGPFDVLTPRRIWLMVVLVSGISLGGYIVYRIVGKEKGAVFAGLIGGLISSTATTVSFSRRAKGAGEGGGAEGNDSQGSDSQGKISGRLAGVGAAALAIILASTVVYGRVIIEIRAVAPQNFWPMAAPIMAMLIASSLVALLAFPLAKRDPVELPEQENPAEIKPALMFAGMYAVVMVLAAAGNHYFKETGVFVVAAISGLTDMDAITLSNARLAEEGSLSVRLAAQSILVASIANMIFKTGIAGVIGGRRLFLAVGGLMGLQALAAAAILFFWPYQKVGGWLEKIPAEITSPEPEATDSSKGTRSDGTNSTDGDEDAGARAEGDRDTDGSPRGGADAPRSNAAPGEPGMRSAPPSDGNAAPGDTSRDEPR